MIDKKQLIDDIKKGKISDEEALEILNDKGYEDVGDAVKIDFSRKSRRGFPEAIYCASKDDESLVRIFEAFAKKKESVIGTRASKAQFDLVKAKLDDVTYNELARIISLDFSKEEEKIGEIAIVCAGTSDLPVLLEAEITAKFLGARVKTYTDVGVAGIHRLLDKIEDIKKANVIIAIAGMEAALATVLAGLVDKPIIAVPTSVGYGANLGGITALLSMINSCAEGVSVVNIDNGYGAAYAACQINKLIAKGN
ncbi:nickel pincer cofactor biosynthesis protein LarB [Anaerococcus sp. NML200574]|uniref:nickel pincer cofactor biosynthesis protein LarB n=1 Tax=Anaerococcus sp. NML200574 TaxID=2954486 RepID=UPI002237E747|nr:nickel pincer cofactor biosynthesis protein LarB [Anaerococcus sp. NML200574]MCW6678521.1 nickel pincer cofactor biosynthesis protein LarB [Anaerococcus sp. NML200574]